MTTHLFTVDKSIDIKLEVTLSINFKITIIMHRLSEKKERRTIVYASFCQPLENGHSSINTYEIEICLIWK